MEYESLELNDQTRAFLPGEFIQLTDGYVHYELTGSPESDVVVLIHGFSAPLMVWDQTYEFLVKNGFRVLRYDLFGRGYSDRPKIKYKMELFTKQLYELVNQLELTNDKFSIVGLSMGGGISVVFADKYPNLVKKVALVDPIGFSFGGNIQLYILKIPMLNKLLMKFIGHKKLIQSQKPDFYQYDRIDEYLDKYKEQLAYKGYLQAIRSTALNTPFTNLGKTYEKLEQRKVPIQLFWGEKDQTIPFKTSRKVLATVPSIEFHPIKDCGHMPQYTHPNEVNPLLLEFLRD